MYETCASAIADAFTARLSRSERVRSTVLASKDKQHRIGAGRKTQGNFTALSSARFWTVPRRPFHVHPGRDTLGFSTPVRVLEIASIAWDGLRKQIRFCSPTSDAVMHGTMNR